MMSKTIAVDLNEVLRDYVGQFMDVYNQVTDSEITYDEITDFDLKNVFKFDTDDDYKNFRYVEYAYDLAARAASMDDKQLPFKFTNWVKNVINDTDMEEKPHIMIVSPFESEYTIPATYSFLARIACPVRELYFPTDSMTIWDKCDVLITANPNLIKNKPEGKVVFKINSPYNKDVKGDYEYDRMTDLINDGYHTIQELVNKEK